jgi:hypothetical protein
MNCNYLKSAIPLGPNPHSQKKEKLDTVIRKRDHPRVLSKIIEERRFLSAPHGFTNRSNQWLRFSLKTKRQG